MYNKQFEMIYSSFCAVRRTVRNNPLKLTIRLQHKTKKHNEKPPPKVSSDVVNFLDSTPEYCEIKHKIPNSLLRKYKAPESMYLINKETAKTIADTVKEYLTKDSPIIEVNPGLGFLSEVLMKCQSNHIYMYEISNHFSQFMAKLQDQYPGRITYKVADFFGMWKLAFRDKMDHGNRIKELLGDLSTEDKNRVVKIIGSMPGLTFVKHLINNIVFHNTTNQLGTPELFITMPGHHYKFLTDDEVQLSKQKLVPTLFQLLFNCKILTSVPKVHFLPWTNPPSSKQMDEYSLYLVNITQKEHLPCPLEYLPLLWYFFKPHMFSKTTRVIPMLEQWIPGCGVRLITGQDPPDTNKVLLDDANNAPLPHMTIFTEFGDLNLKQKITVFKRFISWPEFEQCQFRITMENNLPRFVTELQNDDKDSIPTHIDDDSDVEADLTEFDK